MCAARDWLDAKRYLQTCLSLPSWKFSAASGRTRRRCFPAAGSSLAVNTSAAKRRRNKTTSLASSSRLNSHHSVPSPPPLTVYPWCDPSRDPPPGSGSPLLDAMADTLRRYCAPPSGPPSAAAMRRNSSGSCTAPRPTMSPAQPVSSTSSAARPGDVTSPFPTTGMSRISTASAMSAHCARPEYPCARVRACNVMNSAPGFRV
mmetsp:Transcript_29799/g.74517  ORF Transcript_29799/g.74517 Transcript_29799/m.74517 type:complete len:203 (-) Transcript_29799:228-836(-)